MGEGPRPDNRASLWPTLVAVLGGALYAVFLLASESQAMVFGFLLGGGALLALLSRLRWLDRLSASIQENRGTFNGAIIVGVTAVIAYFHDDAFVLFLVATVLLYTITCLGLNIQFGYAGVVNFAGASFFGVGCYTAAVLSRSTGVPHLLVLLVGGAMAALVGSILLLPVLKTRGHYAAMVTIAFALLLKTFLEVNDALGGPQGLKCPGLKLLGWDFNQNISLGGIEGSFYLSYIALLLPLAVIGFILSRRLEESWVGLNMDAIRLDETASACFGLNIPRWKITAFTIGNFYCGVAGAFYALMTGFIAPNNFTFGDSLILVSIILLGGLGSAWGVVAASAIVILLPEKFQVLQEYRFWLYAGLVIIILLFRPEGLLPRQARRYFQPRGSR